jgi:hypothetical protein
MEEDTMSNQDFGHGSSTTFQSGFGGTSQTSDGSQSSREEAFSRASDMARDAAEQAKRAAAQTASTVTKNIKELLDRQIGTGATVAGHFASSVRSAADDVTNDSPMIAGFVRSFADKIDGYAQGLHEQSADQLLGKASEFTKREPALVFGIAALAGFLAFRTFKTAQPVASPPMQPGQTWPTHPGQS